MGLLPENKRREITRIEKKRIWIYGGNGAGKSFLANAFPDVLLINTDGNYVFVDSPYILIRPTNEGRAETSAWEHFKEVVEELAQYNNTFRTIVVDLIEDIYSYARRDVLKKYKWKHESDGGGYGAGYQLVSDEFMPVINKLLSLDYENIIFLSHDKEGTETDDDDAEIAVINPNIRNAIKKKIGGQMHFVGHLVTEQRNYPGTIKMGVTKKEYSFGRPGFMGKSIPATYEAICEIYGVNPMEMKVTPPTDETPEKPKRPLLKRNEEA